MKKRNIFKGICFMAALTIMVLAGCAEEDEVSHERTCLDRLDSKRYQSVAGDSSCSVYERASAELGLGDVSVKRILDQSDSDNFVDMFNITKENFEDHIQHLETAVALTENRIGSNTAITEVHLVASAVILINEAWGRADDNLDGEIEESEFMDFLKIDSTSTQVSKDSTFEFSNLFQLVDANGNAWIYDPATDPLNWIADTNFNGIIDDGSTSTNIPSTPVTLSQVSYIAGITELQSLFTTDSTSDVQASFDFLEMATEKAGLVDQDLEYLGISSDNEIRKIISDSTDEMDNGATCSRPVVSIVDGFINIIANAARVDTTDEYRTHNLLTTAQAQAISDDLSFYIPPIFAVKFDLSAAEYYVRIKYQKTGASGGFVGLYTEADADISAPLFILDYLALDASGDTIESEKGDGIITLNELLCY